MSEEDRRRWNARYSADGGSSDLDEPRIPALFAPYEDLFPRHGFALEVACGPGMTSVWLATRGLEVRGVDISPLAIHRARDLADSYGVGGRCRFEIADLDEGLPPTQAADVLVCHMFRQPLLYRPMEERLQVGGLLAIAVLSEVGAHPGLFRAGPGELTAAFSGLSVIAGGEGDGRAWLLARKRPPPRLMMAVAAQLQ
ncbi:MAG TPA: class I SAM-dependent methyltransferase [Acidimicrobiales bacterium]|nr:class I SAM-dependent methyltransferase [Acidimicrobiales bacterium]